jgi:hypothetical protein
VGRLPGRHRQPALGLVKGPGEIPGAAYAIASAPSRSRTASDHDARSGRCPVPARPEMTSTTATPLKAGHVIRLYETRGTPRAAVHRGQIPHLRVGQLIHVPTTAPATLPGLPGGRAAGAPGGTGRQSRTAQLRDPMARSAHRRCGLPDDSA